MNETQKLKAYADGEAFANPSKVGDKWLGAKPEAMRAGYMNDTLVTAFINGALDTIEYERMVIRTDNEGRITANSKLHPAATE